MHLKLNSTFNANGWRAGVVCLALLLAVSARLSAQTTTNLPAVSAASGSSTNRDLVAARFMISCAGCHSLAGIKLNGPELTPATAWPAEQLKTAIKRMEKNVGPMPDEQIAALAEFLKVPDIRERLKAEEVRIQAQFLAKMTPPDAALGRLLFLGNEPLRNGGLACAACHTAAGTGGNLGPDLTGVFAKVGGMTPLISGIEQAGYKVMAPHYKRHPVTKQEAMHLAKYFSTLDPSKPAPAQASFVPVGGGIALAMLVGLVFHFRSQRQSRGRDVKLQRRRK
ncbi:MAG: c-type cytochrome [Verrucomicrobia bacterium]|nr:c-type cytochrome [Verrucomicrobiota bacterium]